MAVEDVTGLIIRILGYAENICLDAQVPQQFTALLMGRSIKFLRKRIEITEAEKVTSVRVKATGLRITILLITGWDKVRDGKKTSETP